MRLIGAALPQSASDSFKSPVCPPDAGSFGYPDLGQGKDSFSLSYLCHVVFLLGLGVLITCISVLYSARVDNI